MTVCMQANLSASYSVCEYFTVFGTIIVHKSLHYLSTLIFDKESSPLFLCCLFYDDNENLIRSRRVQSPLSTSSAADSFVSLTFLLFNKPIKDHI